MAVARPRGWQDWSKLHSRSSADSGTIDCNRIGRPCVPAIVILITIAGDGSYCARGRACGRITSNEQNI